MLVIEGKNKDGFISNDHIKFVFSDRLSAFDKVVGSISGRGEVLAECTRVIFDYLEQRNIKTALIDGTDNTIIMQKCKTLPFEFIMRNLLTGSALKRVKSGKLRLPQGMKINEYEAFPEPFVEVSTKREVKDRYGLTKTEIISIMKSVFTDLSDEEALFLFDKAKSFTIDISKLLRELFDKTDLFFVDGKIELGINPEGELVLVDTFGPDEFRVIKKDFLISQSLVGEPDFFDKEFIRRKLKKFPSDDYKLVLKEYGPELVQRYWYVTNQLKENL